MLAKNVGIIGILLWFVLNILIFISSISLGEKVELLLYLFFLLFIPACFGIVASIKDSKPMLLMTIVLAMPFPLFALLSILIAL